MRKTPSMHGLKAFEAAARLMSFKAAADELCVTPAAISSQIHKLEALLGVKLFRRLNRRVELTDAGAKYLVRMRIIFDDIEEATRDIMQKGDAAVISFAVPPMLLKSWLIPRLPDLYEQLPGVNLRIVDTLRYVDFEKEQIDVSIRYGFGGWEGVHIDYLFEEDMCPICSPLLLEGENKLEGPEDLANFRLIYTERRLVQWDNYLSAGGYDQLNVGEKLWFLNSIHTLDAALEGLGVALINRKFVAEQIRKGLLLVPFEWDIQLSRRPAYYFVANDRALLREDIQALRHWILNLAKFTDEKVSA